MDDFYFFILLLDEWRPNSAALTTGLTTLTPQNHVKLTMSRQLLSGITSSYKDVAYAGGSNFFIPVKVVLFAKLKKHKVPLSRDNINSSPQ